MKIQITMVDGRTFTQDYGLDMAQAGVEYRDIQQRCAKHGEPFTWTHGGVKWVHDPADITQVRLLADDGAPILHWQRGRVDATA